MSSSSLRMPGPIGRLEPSGDGDGDAVAAGTLTGDGVALAGVA